MELGKKKLCFSFGAKTELLIVVLIVVVIVFGGIFLKRKKSDNFFNKACDVVELKEEDLRRAVEKRAQFQGKGPKFKINDYIE